MKFKTENNFIFEIDVKSKTIRRFPENCPGAWKSFVRISKPKVGFPVLIVWSVDILGNATKSTLTSLVISVF